MIGLSIVRREVAYCGTGAVQPSVDSLSQNLWSWTAHTQRMLDTVGLLLSRSGVVLYILDTFLALLLHETSTVVLTTVARYNHNKLATYFHVDHDALAFAYSWPPSWSCL